LARVRRGLPMIYRREFMRLTTRCGEPGVTARASVVAQALNRRGIKTGSREADNGVGGRRSLGPAVKRYENRLKDKFKFTGER